jgi:ketopantoate reductase
VSDSASVVGAGSVGLALAARLARGGVRVLLVTRRPEAAQLLVARGLGAEDPASGKRLGFAVRASGELGAIDPPAGPVFVCTRVDAVAEVAETLGGRGAALVTFQNDVVSEATAARFAPRVIGGVWRETATRMADDCVRVQLDRPGRAVVGLHPEGGGPDVAAAAALLARGGVDVSVSPTIGRDKWLKLCVNLMSTPNALVRRPDHTTPEFVEVKARLLEEARAALAAAGIDATPCDGRDRTLDAEIAFQREALARNASARAIPLYNQVWTSLRHGSPLEADGYHERILSLARAHGSAAPVNALVLARLLDAARLHLGPESCAARDLLPSPSNGDVR